MADQRAAMSTKQMTRAALDGRRIVVRFPGLQPSQAIAGYLCGMDDFHWAVVDKVGQVHLVHKSQAIITISRETSYAQEKEEVRQCMDPIVQPFVKALAKLGEAAS